MKLSVQKIDGAFYPKGETAIEAMQTLANQEYVINLTNHRNPAFHRKAFALLNVIFDNQEGFTNFDCFRSWITIKAGYFVTGVTPNNSTFFDAKSLSYEKMDAETFERWYNSVINVAVKEYGQEVNTLNNIMEFA